MTTNAEIVQWMDEANISVRARQTQLPMLGYNSLREWVENKTYEDTGKSIWLECEYERGKDDMTNARLVFHCLGKELVLSGCSIKYFQLVTVVSRFDEVYDYDEVGHLMIGEFYEGGVPFPWDEDIRRKILALLQHRHDYGRHTHILTHISYRENPVSSWWGERGTNWLRENWTVQGYEGVTS